MNRKRRLRVIIGVGVVFTVVVGLIAFRLTLVCCALPPIPEALLTRITGIESNEETVALLNQTNTAAVLSTSTSTPLPYDPTLYAQRRHEYDLLKVTGGPTEYAIFFATEMALVETYQGITIPAQKTMTANGGATSTYGWASVMTQAALSGATFVPTPTQSPVDQTKTAIVLGTSTPTPLPYDPTLYAQRQHEVELFKTAGGPTEWAIFIATETALVATYQGTMLPTSTPRPIDKTGTATATPTSASVQGGNCAYSWAHQDLAEIAEAAREAFSTISSAKIQVLRVDAYGENCNRADGSLSTFAAMTTDFYLSTNVTNLNETRQMAQAVMTAYGVLTELKLKLPAQAGYLDMVYTSGGQEKRFRAMFSQIKRLIETGKGDTELLAAGGM